MHTAHSLRGSCTAAVRIVPSGATVRREQAVPAEHVRPGVCRVGKDRTRPGVGEPVEADLPGPGPAVGAAREPAPAERRDHPVGRPGGGERGEHVGDRGGDLLVRVEHTDPVVVVEVADRQRGAQLTAFGGGPFRALQPPGQQMELCFLCRPRDCADMGPGIVAAEGSRPPPDRHNSQVVEEGQGGVGRLVAAGLGVLGSGPGQCFLLQGKIGVDVDLCGGRVFVTEPQSDHSTVDARSK